MTPGASANKKGFVNTKPFGCLVALGYLNLKLREV